MWGGGPTGKDFLAYVLIIISFKAVDLKQSEKHSVEKRSAVNNPNVEADSPNNIYLLVNGKKIYDSKEGIQNNIQLNLQELPLNEADETKRIYKREADNKRDVLEPAPESRNHIRRSIEEWDAPQLSREAWEGDGYNSRGFGGSSGSRKVPATDIIDPKGHIKCAFPGELFYFWEQGVRCAICVCLISSEGVKPVCVACRTCIPGHPIVPVTPPTRPPPITGVPWPTRTEPPFSIVTTDSGISFRYPTEPSRSTPPWYTTMQPTWDKISTEPPVTWTWPTTPEPPVTWTWPTTSEAPWTWPTTSEAPWTWPTTSEAPWTWPTTEAPWTWPTTSEAPWTWPTTEPPITLVTTPETPATWTWPPTTEPPFTAITAQTPTHPKTKSCRPLPEHTPFINPMNPCQKCVCNVVKDITGADVVSITCEEIPECQPRPMTTPAPMNECKNMPVNVWFPHPYYHDEICICTMAEDRHGAKETLTIMCVKEPSPTPPAPPHILTPTIYPITATEEPITLYPTAETTMTPFFTLPDTPPTWTMPDYTTTTTSRSVTLQPVSPKPVFPHSNIPRKSCKPYKPNVPFDHPWDDCQKCVCREFHDRDAYYIEVDCYTKQECCIEIPLGTVTERYKIDSWPGNKVTTSPISISIPDKLCEGKRIGSVFEFPGDNCYSCVCYLDGPYVYPACKRKQTSACMKSNVEEDLNLIPDVSFNEAHANAASKLWGFNRQPGQWSDSKAGANAHAIGNSELAKANANAYAGLENQWLPGRNQKGPKNIALAGHSQSESQAAANANVQNVNWYDGSGAVANANAEASSNIWGQAKSQASAESELNDAWSRHRPGYKSPRSNLDWAHANAHASAETDSLNYSDGLRLNGGRLSPRDLAQAQASANAKVLSGSEASANAKSKNIEYSKWNQPINGRLSIRDIARANAKADASSGSAANAEADAKLEEINSSWSKQRQYHKAPRNIDWAQGNANALIENEAKGGDLGWSKQKYMHYERPKPQAQSYDSWALANANAGADSSEAKADSSAEVLNGHNNAQAHANVQERIKYPPNIYYYKPPSKNQYVIEELPTKKLPSYLNRQPQQPVAWNLAENAEANPNVYNNEYQMQPKPHGNAKTIFQDGIRCQYEGDKYTDRCAACTCLKSRTNGKLYARCTVRPCDA